MKITILGAGGWGTALAKLLCQRPNEITLWGHNAEKLNAIKNSRANTPYLPGIKLPDELLFDSDLSEAIRDAEHVVVAVPSKAFREVTRQLSESRATLISVTKGIEYESGKTMSQILEELCPHAQVAVLSGP